MACETFIARAVMPGTDSMGWVMVLESFEEHAATQFGMERLLRTKPENESFAARVTTLKEMIQHHVKEKEEDLFPRVEKQMEAAELDALGKLMKARFEQLVGTNDLRRTLDTAEEEQPMPVEFAGVHA